MSITSASEINSLLEVSARIGSEPLLVQAATGNTSIKLEGVLWIKASGKWLAHAAEDDILIPLSLAETLMLVHQNLDPAVQSGVVGGKTLRASIETAMHSVIPQRVVLHVHSVNTLAWAVRKDGPSELASRLNDIDWQWIPDVPSGLPLARAIETAIARAPRTRVFVLSNHGLVVCADGCEAAEELLREVEWRVAVVPRKAPDSKPRVLNRISKQTAWQVPENAELHALSTDAASRRIVCDGVLYPCQAIFLTSQVRSFNEANAAEHLQRGVDEPFVVVEDAGILLRQELNSTESGTLAALVQVVQRIPDRAPLRYLRKKRVRDLLGSDIHYYRTVAENNQSAPLPLGQCEGF